MIFNEFFENKTPPFIDYLFIEEVKLLGIEMLVKNNLDAGVHDAIAEMAWTMLVHINPKVKMMASLTLKYLGKKHALKKYDWFALNILAAFREVPDQILPH